jgi:uncharacterized membrane protein
MVPLLVQVAVTLIARARVPWRPAVRIGMVALFLLTGGSHFSSLKHEFAAMIPPPMTGSLPLVYLTGILEIAGAVGLMIPKFRRAAAWCLIALLAALFPANVYAAMSGVMFQGRPATALWLRTPMQLTWIAALWWSSTRTGPGTVSGGSDAHGHANAGDRRAR